MSQNDKIAEGLKFLREKYGFSSISCVPASTVDPKIIRFGNNVYPHKILHKEHADTELIDYSGEMSPEHCPLNMDNPLDWQFSIDGNVYKSNYSMISEKCRERLKAKYFIVNRSQLARINTKVLKETGKKWVMHVDSLKDFQSYTKALESKTYVIRSFQFYRCEEPEFYVLADDVIDLVILALQAQGVTEEEYDSHVKTLRFMNSSFEEEHFNVMKFDDFEEALEKFDIDKGLITIIPDMILKQNYVRSLTQLSIPITILNQEGDEIMTSPQAGMHIFHSMLCHYDWIGFMEKGEPEVDLTMELEAFFCDILKHYMDMRETTLVSRKYVEMDKEKLRNHRIFSKIQKQDRDHMWKDVEIFQDLPAKEYEKTCNKMNLPVYLVHNVLDLWYARLRWFVGCIEVFFTRESHEEKLFLISGLSQKCPGEAEPITQRFLSEIVHHWEKLRDEWEAKRPPLFSQGTEAVGNKKEEEKKIAKTSGDSKPSASKDSGKAVSKNPEGSGPGVSKAVQKSKTSSKPETSELSGKPQTKPDTQKSIVIKPSEQKSMKSGTPKNPRTPKSVATEKSMTSLETEKAAIMKKVTDELKEVKKTSEKMLKQKEKKKKLEEKLARETEISKNLKEALSEKERLIEE
ncbi:hypothetical protein GCK72_010975 [Caenorhabditis remanei]|uniref:Uncharacterized protein n=1 Tax=Caenorhabditis remanei TaxID=31234 RepID=A0A6A5H877_CAERE|nr:hypothetical protein GCK72_010975 [Caenorhabditis remanei]KAF1762713.1 hypothetical protein GCK72_010975 [Caenorhabditis remanei]